jgi:hypothetical protein
VDTYLLVKEFQVRCALVLDLRSDFLLLRCSFFLDPLAFLLGPFLIIGVVIGSAELEVVPQSLLAVLWQPC